MCRGFYCGTIPKIMSSSSPPTESGRRAQFTIGKLLLATAMCGVILALATQVGYFAGLVLAVICIESVLFRRIPVADRPATWVFLAVPISMIALAILASFVAPLSELGLVVRLVTVMVLLATVLTCLHQLFREDLDWTGRGVPLICSGHVILAAVVMSLVSGVLTPEQYFTLAILGLSGAFTITWCWAAKSRMLAVCFYPWWLMIMTVVTFVGLRVLGIDL